MPKKIEIIDDELQTLSEVCDLIETCKNKLLSLNSDAQERVVNYVDSKYYVGFNLYEDDEDEQE